MLIMFRELLLQYRNEESPYYETVPDMNVKTYDSNEGSKHTDMEMVECHAYCEVGKNYRAGAFH